LVKPLRAVAASILVLAVVGLFIRMSVLPLRSSLQRSSAIVVFGGGGPRIETGARLLAQKIAPILYLSVAALGPGGSCPRETNGTPLPEAARDVRCFVPTPYTTQGEARFVAEMAGRDNWRRVVIITSTPQEARARLRLRRCQVGRSTVVGVRPGVGLSSWVGDMLYEVGADLKALLVQRSC
jgi:uncharacterized SAM-binding protein YcdF (DUF218 family)